MTTVYRFVYSLVCLSYLILDVSRYDGSYEHVFETQVAGITLQAPQLSIQTVSVAVLLCYYCIADGRCLDNRWQPVVVHAYSFVMAYFK